MKAFKTSKGLVTVSKGKKAANYVLPMGFSGTDLIKFNKEHKDAISDIMSDDDDESDSFMRD